MLPAGTKSILRPRRHRKSRIGIRADAGPLSVAHDEVPERDMTPTGIDKEVTRAQCLSDGKSERNFPQCSARRLARWPCHLPPRYWNELTRCGGQQGLRGPGVDRTRDLDRSQEKLASLGSLERQTQERRKVFAQIAVPRDKFIGPLPASRRPDNPASPRAEPPRSSCHRAHLWAPSDLRIAKPQRLRSG
jgi:hypothetical protein